MPPPWRQSKPTGTFQYYTIMHGHLQNISHSKLKFGILIDWGANWSEIHQSVRFLCLQTWLWFQTTRQWTAARWKVRSSVQFKMVSKRSEKPMICAPARLSEVSPTLPFKQFQCLSDWFSRTRSSRASSFHVSLLQAIDSVMSLSLD